MGINYVKCWNKKLFWFRVPTVVFAKTQEAGELFIKTQNMICHHFTWWPLYALLDVVVMIIILCLTGLTAENILLAGAIGFIPVVYYLCLAKWATQNEKIYQGNVTWYTDPSA